MRLPLNLEPLAGGTVSHYLPDGVWGSCLRGGTVTHHTPNPGVQTVLKP